MDADDARDAPADALTDLETDNNELSLWRLEDFEAQLDRCLAALAGKREHVGAIDFLVLEDHDVSELQLPLRPTLGTTADDSVNLWHVDLCALTAGKLAQIAKCGCRGGRIQRRREKDVSRLLKSGLEQGNLARQKISSSLLSRLAN